MSPSPPTPLPLTWPSTLRLVMAILLFILCTISAPFISVGLYEKWRTDKRHLVALLLLGVLIGNIEACFTFASLTPLPGLSTDFPTNRLRTGEECDYLADWSITVASIQTTGFFVILFERADSVIKNLPLNKTLKIIRLVAMQNALGVFCAGFIVHIPGLINGGRAPDGRCIMYVPQWFTIMYLIAQTFTSISFLLLFYVPLRQHFKSYEMSHSNNTSALSPSSTSEGGPVVVREQAYLRMKKLATFNLITSSIAILTDASAFIITVGGQLDTSENAWIIISVGLFQYIFASFVSISCMMTILPAWRTSKIRQVEKKLCCTFSGSSGGESNLTSNSGGGHGGGSISKGAGGGALVPSMSGVKNSQGG
jgi:hypothetical protein